MKTHELFDVHMLNEEGKSKAVEIAKVFSVLLYSLETMMPSNSRNMSIVKTKLQEAAFFAKREMAEQKENQV
jgi:hypothetical protein